MFELNPHHLLDAWWQHLLMLFVSALLGYIIGHRQGMKEVNRVEDQLARLGVELEKCRKSLIVKQPDIIAATLISQADDLKIIEGIGPRIEKLLNASGIRNFAQLSTTPVEKLREILRQGGSRYSMHNPATWPQQASLAHEGKWEELDKLQQELDAGNLI